VNHKLKDFGSLKQALTAQQKAQREQERQARQEEARRKQLQREQAEQAQVFARTVGPVHKLPDTGKAVLQQPRPEPVPRQRLLDEAAALQEALSDEIDVESLLLTDDGLSFRRPGIGPDVLSKLRRGHWAIQSQLDLHGLRRDEAREEVSRFVRQSRQRGLRCVRVIHGKGHGSPGRQPVLKQKVQRWLAQCQDVIAFAQASGPQGGAGALIVLLQG